MTLYKSEVGSMKEEIASLLNDTIDSIQYPQNLFTIWYSEDKILMGAFLHSNSKIQKFINCGTIYNNILDLDSKIKFSLKMAIKLAEDVDFEKWNPFQSPSDDEHISVYYIENAVFRISALWDLLAQLFNVYAELGVDLDKIYATQLFHNAQQGKHANSFAKKVYSYMDQSDDLNAEPWKGNYKYVKEMRDKLIHKISPNISSLSSFKPELRMPALYILKRVVEDYKQVFEFIHEIVDEILADYKILDKATPSVDGTL